MARSKKKYGFGKLLFDLIFGLLTGGIWWLILFIIFLRKNS